MYDQKHIERYLNDIFKSPEFCNSEIYRNLLAFLVKYSLKGQTPKEINIAVEFFGKDTRFDASSDSIVRSHMHHLRKKLDSYYRNTGRQDDIQLTIPKGHYAIHFEDAESKSVFTFKLSEIILLFLFLSLAVFQLYQWMMKRASDYPVTSKDQIIWQPFFQNDRPLLLILGDHYFYMGPSATNPSSAIRDFAINSDSDLNNFLVKHPDKISVINKTSHTYMTKRIPWAINTILPSFVMHQKNIELKLASEVQWDDFQKYDIIFIGAFRSLGVTGKLIEELPFDYDCKNGILTLTQADTLSVQYNAGSCSDFQTEMQEAKDYAMVIRSKGLSGRHCLFFLSTHDIGIISTTRQFTDAVQLKQFSEQYLSGYEFDSFYALFRVHGVARTDFEIDLLYFNRYNTTGSAF